MFLAAKRSTPILQAYSSSQICFRVILQQRKTISSTTNSAGSIDFSDTKVAFQSKSTLELLRALTVFSTCRIKPLVSNAERLLRFSYKTLGYSLTDNALKMSFFGHFCAGEDEESIKPVIKHLESYGVGSILDYAAESDVEASDDPVSIPQSTTTGKVKARVYDYKNEQMCDKHMKTFEKAIVSVKKVSPTGFAAIKLTALGNPELLRRASLTLTEIKKLFHRLDKEGKGVVTKEDFLKTFNTKIDGKDVLGYFDVLDGNKDGMVDYIEWTNGLKLEELHLLTAHCTVQGPLSASVLNDEELILLKRMRERVFYLSELAESLGVRLMIDAEHSYFQPAIDQFTYDLSRLFNKPGSAIPVIFSTYQMYLKDSMTRLITDMDRAKKGGYKFAAKLVRGAYMVIERQHAKDVEQIDPINVDIQTTHDNYNAGVKKVIDRISLGEDVEVMIATHNQHSVSQTVNCMVQNNLDPKTAPVYFGQLLGMADNLTFTLAHNGYKAYKYVPYGRVHEVMPYLIRRAQENSDALSGAKLALDMSKNELKRRILG